MSVAVVTSIYGDYDQLQAPPEQSIDVEWVCVTDTLDASAGPWKIVPERRPNLPPRLAAKIAKCLPHEYVSMGHEAVIWMDGSCHLKDPLALERVLAATQPGDISQFQHPVRRCMFDEAAFSAGLPKYVHQPILAQATWYGLDGHPVDWGLWATGFIVYRAPRDICDMLGRSWLAEQMRWTDQDQISQPYVWRRAAMRPTILPGALGLNDYVTWTAHRDGT